MDPEITIGEFRIYLCEGTDHWLEFENKQFDINELPGDSWFEAVLTALNNRDWPFDEVPLEDFNLIRHQDELVLFEAYGELYVCLGSYTNHLVSAAATGTLYYGHRVLNLSSYDYAAVRMWYDEARDAG